MAFRPKKCLECGSVYTPVRGGQRFCSTAHRKAFHRRREQRGAEVYDFLMAYRFDRGDTGPECFKLMCRYAGLFREEDKAAGRKRSWLTLRELREDGALAGLTSDGWKRVGDVPHAGEVQDD